MYGNQRDRMPDLLDSPSSRKDLKNMRISNDHLRRYEAAVKKYDKSSLHPRQRLTNHARLEQQYYNFQGYSSSDECLLRSKSKSVNSIDTQSINNILDEFDDLENGQSSDLSDFDVGNAEVTNFEEMMNMKKRHMAEKLNSRMFRSQNQNSSLKDHHHQQHSQHYTSPAKVSRQTQVQQRSRDRQKENEKRFLSPPEDSTRQERKNIASAFQNQEVRASIRSAKSPPEVLLRKGEVQKRVDEWLSQTRSQNCVGFAKESRGLTRSNSSAEQKSHRRQRQQELRSRRCQMNVSSSYDDLSYEGLQKENNNRIVDSKKVSVGVNTSRGTYRQYLALKNKSKIQKQQQQQENFNPQENPKPNLVFRSREASPAGPRNHQHSRSETTNLSFRNSPSKKFEHEQRQQQQLHSLWTGESTSPINVRNKNNRARQQMENRISSLVKARNDMAVAATEIPISTPPASVSAVAAPGVNRRSSFKRESIRNSTKSTTSNFSGNKTENENSGSAGTSSPSICQDRMTNSLQTIKSQEQSTKTSSKTVEAKSLMETNLDQPQESYGSVSARVRAFQSRSEFRTPKTMSLQGSNVLIETRNKSPISPIKKDCFNFKEYDRNASSFKPNQKEIPASSQNNEQNFNHKEIESTTKYVEKIYESTLQPEVKYADNLESVFRPACTNFVYGDATTEHGSTSTIFPTKNGVNENLTRSYHVESEPKQSDSGINHCLKLLQRSPSFRLKRSPPVNKEKESYMKLPNNKLPTNDRSASNFGTFQTENSSSNISQHKNYETQKEITQQLVMQNKPEPNLYESRSTLKLNSGPRTVEDLIENDNNLRKDGSLKVQRSTLNKDIINLNHQMNESATSSTTNVSESTYSSLRKVENGSVVNEPTIKRPSPTPPPPPPRTCLESIKRQDTVIELVPTQNRPLNYNSVLNEDYLNSRTYKSQLDNGTKIYVTKEEMELKKLIDLLKKGEYELAKQELERSYTLSSPGVSPTCCPPPCSPPPAPAAYISSARASSRRLASLGIGAGGSPERDPLGRLLSYLKTFYRDLGTRDPPHLPQWASPLPPGTLCPAHFQPHLQIVHKSEQEHRLENIKIDQIFTPVRLSDSSIAEAPRRVSLEGGPSSGRTTLCLRLLYQWATQPDSSSSPALVFIVPLRELKGGGSVLTYLTRELFRGPLTDTIQQVWRTLQLLEDRVLFILDGYDECPGGRASLGDALDILEGRLFPEARVLVTCSANDVSQAIGPLVQRRIHLAGLEWPHVERLCLAYFIHNDMAKKAGDFLEVLNIQPLTVRQLAQHPLGWLMLCVLYQDTDNLPTDTSALVQAAVKGIVKRSLEPAVPYNNEIPNYCRKRLEDFGKLALAALREGRCYYTETELRTRGGGIEIARLGFLNKGVTLAQRKKSEVYTPIQLSVAEFLSAYYLSSVAQYANILRRELEGLNQGIIGHLAGLLGPKTHLVLNQLCPLEVPPRGMFSLLKAAGASDGNVAAICRLVGAGPGFCPGANERAQAPLVHCSPLELEGWAKILSSSACSLEALEVVFQVERGSDPKYLDEFFEALAGNESVKLVRITSLLGQEFPADEVLRLAEHVKSVLGKKKLYEFELVITCLEESAHDRLECVVSALCRGMSMASSQLSRLVLDMNLSGEQVSRICEVLRHCHQVQALHLPHLGCGCEGLAAVAELLNARPLQALNLAGSWGTKNETQDPSSSGISMGSGSGSSGCASSTLGSLPTNRCYSSLPRGALAAYGGSNRPATLPRLPLGMIMPSSVNGNGTLPSSGGSSSTGDRDSSNGSSKRNSDSVLCHRAPMHPLPTCDIVAHQGSGFHEIFNAIRDPNCKLRSLNVSKCLLSGLDAACLSETIRLARNLDAVRAAGASRPADVIPLVLALAEAPCLQLLDLASPRLALDDHPCRLLCHALARNSTLRLLSLEGWTFRIEESETLSVFSELLRCTSVRELSLCNARLHLAVHEGPLSRLGRRDDAGAELLRAAAPPACPDIVFLRLAGFQVTVNDRLALRGPLLLPFLSGFTGLSELDLSLDKSTIGGSNNNQMFIDDRILVQFFSCFASHFRSLQSLRINFWRISLEDSERTLRQVGKHLRGCGSLRFLKAAGLLVTDSAKKTRVEHGLIQALLANLQSLQWLCLDGVELNEVQAASIGKCLRERFAGPSLEISAKDVSVKAVKALVSSIEEGARAEVLYAGGAACRLKMTKIQKSAKTNRKK